MQATHAQARRHIACRPHLQLLRNPAFADRRFPPQPPRDLHLCRLRLEPNNETTLGKLENKSYFRRMETSTIEQRMARIEREFDQLKHQVLDLKPRARDWRSTASQE